METAEVKKEVDLSAKLLSGMGYPGEQIGTAKPESQQGENGDLFNMSSGEGSVKELSVPKKRLFPGSADQGRKPVPGLWSKDLTCLHQINYHDQASASAFCCHIASLKLREHVRPKIRS